MRVLDRGPCTAFCLLLLLITANIITIGWARCAAAQSGVSSNQHLQLEGELEILHQDFQRRGRFLYFLKLPDGSRLRLHFVKEPPTNLLTGMPIRARGVMDQTGTLMLASGNSLTNLSAGTTASTPPLPNTFGAQSTLVILVNFQDAPSNEPWTAAQVQSEVFGGSATNGFVQEASYGQTWLTGNVYGWYTISVNSTTCDPNQIATAANNAASASGANLGIYARFVYVFPYNSTCVWSGMATIGGNPSQSWINGGGTTNNTLDLGTFAHEIGHNFGLYHSHGLDCGSVTLSGACTVYEYFDTMDMMGSGQGHYNSFQKERLGWLNYGSSPPITAVIASGAYAVVPYETTDSNPKALKILKFTNPTNGLSFYYYIEYRQPLGFDSFMPSAESNGVVVHFAQQGTPNSSDLLDMTPGDSNWFDQALTVGASYSDPDAGVVITVQSVNSSGATVNISMTTPSCLRALPAISMAPAQAGPVPPGARVNYTVSVTNNDSPSCGLSTFNLRAAIPYGWTNSLSSSQLTLSPGASSSISLSVTSASNSNDGSDPIGVTATNIADFVYSASAWATYMVGTPLTVIVSTNQGSFSPGQSVTVTAMVSYDGSPISNAATTFTIIQPNGSTLVQGSATTNSNGVASFIFKLSRKSPTGTYQAKVQANGAASSGSASTTFLVN